MNSNRLDYLDAARAFALILGIVFHASLSFMPVFVGWAVMDVSTGAVVPSFVLVSHSFRMELFFLIAGFFSHMTFHRQGAHYFIRSRLTRIALPFVVGWFILYPLVMASWVMGGTSMRGEVDILEGLLIGFQSLGAPANGPLAGTHLWFLYYLILITGLTLVLRFLLALLPGVHRELTRRADFLIAWLARSQIGMVAIAIPTAAFLLLMNSWTVDTPDRSIVPHIPVLVIYGSFFLVGWMFHRQKGLIDSFSALTQNRVILAALAIGATLYLSRFQGDIGHPNRTLFRIGFSFSYALMMWSLVTIAIGLFQRFFNKPSTVIRYVADASYWLYLVHLPIVVFLQIAFAELNLHWSIKLFAISGITIGLSLLLYDLFVRSTLIGIVLNGRMKPRVLFTSRPHGAPALSDSLL